MTAHNLILTTGELQELTGKERYKAQMRVLNALGVPYRPRPDGSPCVMRAAAEAALGVPVSRRREDKVTVDVSAL